MTMADEKICAVSLDYIGVRSPIIDDAKLW